MALHKLAREIDETARQTAEMVDGITEAIELLADPSVAADQARADAVRMIVTALQGQDRIAQRCRNMAIAVRQFALLPPNTPDAVFEEIWAGLELDELRVPALSGIAGRAPHGEVELF